MVPSPSSPSNPSATAQIVKEGDLVLVRYRGTLDDGEEFDSNLDASQEPLEFEVGAGEVIPGFEAAVAGMRVGETKKVRLAPEDAYGLVDEDLVQEVGRDEFGDQPVEEGMVVEIEDEDGNQFTATILEADAETVTLDLNHELAGQALNFEITVVGVQKPE